MEYIVIILAVFSLAVGTTGQPAVRVQFNVLRSHFCGVDSELTKAQIESYMKCGVLTIPFDKAIAEKCLTTLDKDPLKHKDDICSRKLKHCVNKAYADQKLTPTNNMETDDGKKAVACGATALGIDVVKLLADNKALRNQLHDVLDNFCDDDINIVWSENAAQAGEKCEYTYHEARHVFNTSEDMEKNMGLFEKCRNEFWKLFGKPMTFNEKRLIICKDDHTFFERRETWFDCIRKELKIPKLDEDAEHRMIQSQSFVNRSKKRAVMIAKYMKCMADAYKLV